MKNEVIAIPERAPTPVNDTAVLLQVLERAASNPEVDVEKMERLMAMYERQGAKVAEQEFNAAMTKAQSEMGRVSADAKNKQTGSVYASYGHLDKVLRPIYTKHGFSLSFSTAECPKPEHVRVICFVSHEDGHGRTYQTDMPADGKGAKGGDVMTKTHAAGSAMSYGMRYLLKMIFNVAIGEDDDDGNKAGMPRINEEQIANIEAMITEIGENSRKGFLKYMKVNAVEDIASQAYGDAIKALERKRASL